MKLRPADSEDSNDIWEWRNDPTTRAMSRIATVTSWESHCTWFAAAQKNENKVIYIGTEGETDAKIGMVRFDIDPANNVAETSINLNPAMRGKSLSQPFLALAAEKFSHYFNGDLVAEIRSENSTSIRIFENVGFVEHAEEQGMKKFRKPSRAR
ncbi:MAG: GNAT family N-acetyltransferase [Rhodospirillaceae bacterium]|nr:GNAT family N-acetyltransferase [Rhodospirillaceae bacterium]